MYRHHAATGQPLAASVSRWQLAENSAEMQLSKAKVEAEGAEMSPVTDTIPGIWPVNRWQTMRGRAVRAPAVRNCRCRASLQIAHRARGGPPKFSRTKPGTAAHSHFWDFQPPSTGPVGAVSQSPAVSATAP